MSRGRKVGSAYPMTALNRWFAVMSALFLVSMVWMCWDDYARPWKDYQRKFVRMQRERAEAELAAIRPDRKALKAAHAAEKKALAAVAKHDAKLKKLRAERDALDALYFPANMDYKFAKGGKDKYRYDHDFASGQVSKYRRMAAEAKQKGDAAAAAKYTAKAEKWEKVRQVEAAELGEKIAEVITLDLAAQKLNGELMAKDREIAKITGALAAARKLLSQLRQARTKLETRLQDLKTDWVFEVRNAPLMDFLAPNIKVEQVVLNDMKININFAKIHTVDRCMTCHIAIDKPGWEQTIRRVNPATYLTLKKRYKDKLTKPAALRSSKDWGAVQSMSASQAADAVKSKGGLRRVTKKNDKGKGISFGKELTSPKAVKRLFKGKKNLDVQVRAAYAVSHPSEHPFATHPDVKMFTGSVSPHPMGVFGCRSCHNGLGRATDFYRAVHMPDNEKTKKKWEEQYNWHQMKDMYWNRPMYPKSYTDAGCVHCHTTVVEMEPMPWMKVGAEPAPAVAWARKPGSDAPAAHAGQTLLNAQSSFLEHGCNGCHKVDTIIGEPKAGPGLVNLASKLDRRWVRRWIENPRAFRKHTRMPQVFKVPHHLDPMAEQATTPDDFGTFLALDTIEKTATTKGTKLADKYLKQFKNRKQYYSAIMDAEMSAVVEALFINSGDIELKAPEKPGDATKGKEAFLDKGCLACHKMDDYKTEGEPAKRFGPDLSNIANKLNSDTASEWLYTWLLDPKAYHANSRMPDPRLSPKDAADIAAYLVTKKKGADDKQTFDKISTKAPVRDLVEMRLVNFLEGNMSSRQAWRVVRALREPGGKASRAQLVWLGEKVLGKQGCFGCHEMNGTGRLESLVKAKKKAWDLLDERTRKMARSADFNKMAGIGVELSDWGHKYLSKLEFGLQKHLTKTHWVFAKNKIQKPRLYDEGMYKGYDDMLRMPWFGFDDATAKLLATYVTGLKKRDHPPKYRYLASDRNWKTRTFLTQQGNANSSWVSKDVAAWNKTDRTDFAGVVARLESYSSPSQKERRKIIEPVADKLAKNENPTDAQALEVWLLNAHYEGTLDGQWMNAADRRKAIVAGRQLVRRHNCRGCHQIEGQGGQLSVYISRFRNSEKPGRISSASLEESPPWLDNQGERTRAAWLFKFLQDPDSATDESGVLRRWLTMKMPKYGFSVEEANILTRYFAALNGTSYPNASTWGTPTDAEVTAATKLFKDKKCLTCHGKDVTGSRAAPYLELAGDRLREVWVRRWLLAPTGYLPYTSMIQDSLQADNKWVDQAHAEARKYVRVILHPPSIRKIRATLGN